MTTEDKITRPTSVTAACGSTANVAERQNYPTVYQRHCHGCRFSIAPDGSVTLINHNADRLCFFRPGNAPVGVPDSR